MEWYHLYIILAAIIAIVVGVILYFRKRFKRKMVEQQSLVDQHKVTTTILVLEKRRDKITNANIPKAVIDQVPKIYKMRKVPIVKAKIGPQIMDLMCDEAVFDKLPDKKSVKVELAGIFIAGIKHGKK